MYLHLPDSLVFFHSLQGNECKSLVQKGFFLFFPRESSSALYRQTLSIRHILQLKNRPYFYIGAASAPLKTAIKPAFCWARALLALYKKPRKERWKVSTKLIFYHHNVMVTVKDVN